MMHIYILPRLACYSSYKLITTRTDVQTATLRLAGVVRARLDRPRGSCVRVSGAACPSDGRACSPRLPQGHQLHAAARRCQVRRLRLHARPRQLPQAQHVPEELHRRD